MDGINDFARINHEDVEKRLAGVLLALLDVSGDAVRFAGSDGRQYSIMADASRGGWAVFQGPSWSDRQRRIERIVDGLCKRLGVSPDEIEEDIQAMGCAISVNDDQEQHGRADAPKPVEAPARNPGDGRVKVAEAARLLGLTPMFVRIGLRTQRLPIGTAVKMPGGRWSYHISEKLLREYAGHSGNIMKGLP